MSAFVAHKFSENFRFIKHCNGNGVLLCDSQRYVTPNKKQIHTSKKNKLSHLVLKIYKYYARHMHMHLQPRTQTHTYKKYAETVFITSFFFVRTNLQRQATLA